MAFNFSAEQFEDRFKSTRLGNWEVPKPPAGRPNFRTGSTKVLCNNNGHFLANVYKKPHSTPWGNFRSTWEFPDRITRRFANNYKECIEERNKWKTPKFCNETNNLPDLACETKCQTLRPFLKAVNERNRRRRRPLHTKSVCDFKPKMLKIKKIEAPPVKPNTSPIPKETKKPKAKPNICKPCYAQKHPSHELLLEDKYAADDNADIPMSKLNLEDHECRLNDFHEIRAPPSTTLLPQTTGLIKPLISPAIPDDLGLNYSKDLNRNSSKMPHDGIAAKPNERCPSPIVPAYANFDIAKRMHYGNLDHQPLPDCIADIAYRKSQITGGDAGLALNIDPIATGVGIKVHNAGPTHCTKMKVYRPKTCGVVPRSYNADNDDFNRPFSSTVPNKKMGAMDLAICWDYKPANPADEPRPAKHIDGSNESTGPAVFTCVKTPRDEPYVSSGRSAGVFNNTLGEAGIFDKDIMRRKADFGGRNLDISDPCRCSPPARARSVTRDVSTAIMPSRMVKQYKSTPNLIEDSELKRLREKYLGPDTHCSVPVTGPACKRAGGGFFKRARSRFCHKVAPAIERACPHTSTHIGHHVPCRAFRVGIPHYDAAGHFVSSDSGCSSSSNHAQRVLVVPRPRIPYSKRNYDIDTLVPPFRCHGGGAGEGGYPEHWRLASVYQHAYKPMEQRRRPLLQTVYK